MNTADRSIALLDVALRRRFAFLEIMPEPELLNEVQINIEEEDPLDLMWLINTVNKRIVSIRGRDYQIGHSYFLPIKEISDDEQKLELLDDIWNYQVIPLLQEYFYGQTDLLQQVLPSFYLQDDEDQQQDGTLEPLHGEDLISALNDL
jgi:5-methylcytosine-specific restriction protein B